MGATRKGGEMRDDEHGQVEGVSACIPRMERHPRPWEPSESLDPEDSFLSQFALVDEPSLRPIPGERLGGADGQRFRILEDLGQGGMGLVIRAWDEVLHRTVALKFLAPQSRLAQASLLREEARAVARLDHENIVRILDLSEWHGTPAEGRLPFLVMEYLEGESLASLLRRGPFDLRPALDVLGAVAAGLAHAHARQVIHRDLKPGNVFLTRDGRVKLLDFGLARLAARGTASSPSWSFSGTPAYMAPEQWRGTPQDARTDIWAAGLVLFEMLTGALPFQARTFEELRARVLAATPVPSVRERRSELPEDVERILARALAREPERRFPSAEALREQVEALARTLDSQRAPSPHAAQHRQVTLVACRLAGLTSQLSSSDVNELVDAFQKGCEQRLRQQGCTVTMGVGDELVACFGHPVAHEDDSERAVRAGLALATELARDLKQKLPHLPLPGLAVRVGVHTDRVVMGEPGVESRAVTAISGEAPKVAAWLANEAEPGTVLLSPSTQALVQGVFETEPLGARPFAGLARTVDLEVYRLHRERKGASRFERARSGGVLTPFVGREAELQTLLDLWSRTRRGRGAAVLVRGEAGIGKSRLLLELRERAGSDPAWYWKAQCWRQASNSAFYPVIELLQNVLGLTAAGEPARKREWLDARLGALGLSPEQLELIALLLSLPVDERSPMLLLTSDERRQKTREVLSALVLRMATERPVLLGLEDLQWADPSTLELLGFVLERIPTARLLILMTARDGFEPPWPEGPHFHTLGLERLSKGHTEALVTEVAHGGALPTETVRHLVTRAEGIPLFIEELTRRVLAEKPGDGDPLSPSIPVTLYELLLARLDLLLPGQKALAQLCAVVGRSVTPALLAPLSGEKNEARLGQALSDLVEAGVLQREASELLAEPRYRFRHALIQDAAYQSLLRSTRRQHHDRIARLLEEAFPQVVETQPEWLAHHYTEAGDAGRAICYWRRAGESANERSAYVEAMGHLRQGLALLEALPDATMRIQEEIALRTALGLALVELDGYGAPRAEQTHAQLQELLRQVDAARLPTDVSYWSLFMYFYSRGMLPAARELAGLLLDAGQRLHNQELLWQGHRMLASVLCRSGEFATAEAELEIALSLLAKRGDEPPRITARNKYGVVAPAAAQACSACCHSLLGHPDWARVTAREAFRLAEESGHPHTLAYVQTYLAMAHVHLREPREALAWAERNMALAQEHGLKVWLGWSQVIRAWGLAQLGQLQEGLQLMRVHLEAWRGVGLRMFLTESCGMRADVHLQLGALEEGFAAVREGMEWVAQSGERDHEAELYRLQGELLREAGREAEASRSLLRALEIARWQGARLLELRAAVSLGRQLQAKGRPGEALSLLKQSSEGLDLHLDAPDFQDARELFLQLS